MSDEGTVELRYLASDYRRTQPAMTLHNCIELTLVKLTSRVPGFQKQLAM